LSEPTKLIVLTPHRGRFLVEPGVHDLTGMFA
jgi:hypothetical protein